MQDTGIQISGTFSATSIILGPRTRNLDSPKDLNLAARFIGEGAFDTVSGKRVSVGSRTIATAAADFCEIDYEQVFKPCRTATDSSSETIEKLMANLDIARTKRNPAQLPLGEIEQIFVALYSASGRHEKQQILVNTWQWMTPVEIKYFIRILGQGSLRIGFETRSVVSAIANAFGRALAHGNEGLMLKRKESRYEYGQRKKSWLKVKKPGGTLDTVIMYAHAGSGKRGGTYSDFTLGISVKDDERYEEEFIPIGKAYGGYTADELRRMNEKIKELSVERYGPTLGLIPELVAEIEFDDIQTNKRTKAGYTLRRPRFKAIRWDLSPRDADTLKDVEKLYRQKIEQQRRRQGENASFVIYEINSGNLNP